MAVPPAHVSRNLQALKLCADVDRYLRNLRRQRVVSSRRRIMRRVQVQRRRLGDRAGSRPAPSVVLWHRVSDSTGYHGRRLRSRFWL
jgi:hypothetical protein